MCLAVPVRVEEILPQGKLRVQAGEGGIFLEISSLLLEEMPKPGDFVIVHAGFALRTLDPQEAEESLSLFRRIAELDV